ncbi:MAG: hypothetical protein LWY06_03960 [Firmicutes bacterium]|nr:hypothetical protein [Bacillota bacterium]
MNCNNCGYEFADNLSDCPWCGAKADTIVQAPPSFAEYASQPQQPAAQAQVQAPPPAQGPSIDFDVPGVQHAPSVPPLTPEGLPLEVAPHTAPYQMKANKKYMNRGCPVCLKNIFFGDEITVCGTCDSAYHTDCFPKNGCQSERCRVQRSDQRLPQMQGRPGNAGYATAPQPGGWQNSAPPPQYATQPQKPDGSQQGAFPPPPPVRPGGVIPQGQPVQQGQGFAPPAGGPPPQLLADEKYCVNCGRPIKRVAAKCKYCNAIVDQRLKNERGFSAPGGYVDPNMGKNAVTMAIIGCILFFVPVAAIVLGILAIKKGKDALLIESQAPQGKTAYNLGIVAVVLGACMFVISILIQIAASLN